MAGQAPLTLRRWRRVEYDRLVDLGTFDDDPIELLGGHLVVAEPKGPYHTSAVGAAEYAVRAALPPGWIVRTQAPVALDDESEPEPDLAVVPGRPGDYRDAIPRTRRSPSRWRIRISPSIGPGRAGFSDLLP